MLQTNMFKVVKLHKSRNKRILLHRIHVSKGVFVHLTMPKFKRILYICMQTPLWHYLHLKIERDFQAVILNIERCISELKSG